MAEELIEQFVKVGGFAVLALLVYFIYKRMQDKDKEDFEKRDN